MAMIILFGLPGAGKTFVGEYLRDTHGFYFYDGDQDLPTDMMEHINKSLPVTEDMRDRFFLQLISSVQKLKSNNIVVAQTFIKEKYRQWMMERFPEAKFILIEAEEK